MKRRDFLKTSVAVGAATVLNSRVMSAAASAETPDMAVAQGTDYFQNSVKAVELLGGMRR